MSEVTTVRAKTMLGCLMIFSVCLSETESLSIALAVRELTM